MGPWTISIHGVGCHHNPDLPSDANRMAAEFVKALRAAGHSVTAATITFGGEDNLSQPTVYLDDRSATKGPRCGKTPDGLSCRLVVDHEGPCLPPVWRTVL